MIPSDSTIQSCHTSCSEIASKYIKITFMDRIIGRSFDEKLGNHCHLDCLKNLNLKNIKRNGRWGFKPVLGMTEAFSSLFALLSFFFMVSGFNRKIKGKILTSPLFKLYYLQYYIANAAFLSSFMFHARETLFTRYADYFTAFASILVGLVVSMNRLVLLKNPSISSQFCNITLRISVFYFIFHIYKMAFHEFNYSYNKISCAVMFFASFLCNFTTFLNYKELDHSWNILYSIGCLILAGMIEMLDVAPVFYLFDSHAMWHLLMALATPFYIEFVSKDLEYHHLSDVSTKANVCDSVGVSTKANVCDSVGTSSTKANVCDSVGTSSTKACAPKREKRNTRTKKIE